MSKPAAPARRSTVSRPQTAAARPSAKAEPVASESAITNVGNKDKRLEVDRRARWTCEELRPDYVEKLTDALRQITSVEMQDKMLAADFKKNCQAITILANYLTNDPETILGVLDLLVKWIFVKMWDTSNT